MDINLAKTVLLLSSPRKQWGKTWIFQYSPESKHHTWWAYYYGMKTFSIWQVINRCVLSAFMWAWKKEIVSVKSEYTLLTDYKSKFPKNEYMRQTTVNDRQDQKNFFILFWGC